MPILAAWTSLDLFFNHFLQHVPIERQIGHQALQPGVLVFQSLQPTSIGDVQAPELRLELDASKNSWLLRERADPIRAC